TTCELAIPRDARRAVYAGRDLPLPKPQPRRIVVPGDTGCRILGPTDAQPCDDPARWPFARVARAAAATHPDLVIHVGDYPYREQMERLLAASESGAWFLSHHPPLAFAANPSRPMSPYPGNATLLSVLQSLNGEAYFPAHVKLLVAGHNHVFEAVSFASGHP